MKRNHVLAALVIITLFAGFWTILNRHTLTDEETGIEFKYHAYLPKYDNKDLPLIILLQGNGDSADNFYQSFIGEADVRGAL